MVMYYVYLEVLYDPHTLPQKLKKYDEFLEHVIQLILGLLFDTRSGFITKNVQRILTIQLTLGLLFDT